MSQNEKEEVIELSLETNNSAQDAEFRDTDIEAQSSSLKSGDQQLDDKQAQRRAYVRNYGAYLCFRFRNGEPQIAIGPHWPLFCCAWTCLFIVALYCLSNLWFSKASKWVFFASFLVNIWQLSSYMWVALKNPGIASSPKPLQNEEEASQHQRYCKPCQIVRPSGTYHCYDCDVCIHGFDHHCPWTGKCIGSGNMQEFFHFLCMTVVFMVFNILSQAVSN